MQIFQDFLLNMMSEVWFMMFHFMVWRASVASERTKTSKARCIGFFCHQNVSKIIKPRGFDKHHISSNLWHITSNNKIWQNNTTGWLFTTNQTSKSWLRSAPRWSHRISKPVQRHMVTHGYGNTAVWPICSSAECTAMRAERGPLSGVWQKNNRSSTKKNTKNNFTTQNWSFPEFWYFLVSLSFRSFLILGPGSLSQKSNNFSPIFLLELLFPPQPRRTGFRVSFCPLFWSHQELTKTMPVLNNPSGTSQQTQPSCTHWKINIESKHHPIEKEIHLPNLHFLGSMWIIHPVAVVFSHFSTAIAQI